MTLPRRERLVDTVWPELDKLPQSVSGDRSLRKAMVHPYSSPGTGVVRPAAADGSVPGLTSGDDVLIERTLEIAVHEFLPSPMSAHPPVVSTMKKELEKYIEHERLVLSQIVDKFTKPLNASRTPFPDRLIEGVRISRQTLGEGPLDLLLSTDHAEEVESSEQAAAVVTALRGGSILRVATVADGTLLTRFPGPMRMGEVDPLRIEWDFSSESDKVHLILWQRLRFFDAIR